MSTKPIYLDCHAHAPLDPRIGQILVEAFTSYDANPHSTHAPGEAAHRAVEQARVRVAELIGATPAEIVFTSGATEANNLAILGLRSHLAASGRHRFLVGAGEHPSVLAAADLAAGGVAERIPLSKDGVVDMDALDTMLGSDVGIVSIAAANHEIGTIQPIADIARLTRSVGALLHSDLAQIAGWREVNAAELDLASISAHKMGGPSGIGALYIRRRHRRNIRPITYGGGQEHGARSGTLPAPLCVAFGETCRLATAERDSDSRRISQLRDDLLASLERVGGLAVNGGSDRLPGNLNLSFDGVDGEALTLRLRDQVAVSTGSACTSASLEPSHVLGAVGITGSRAMGAIRFGLGRATTAEEIKLAAEAVIAAVAALRAMSRRAA